MVGLSSGAPVPLLPELARVPGHVIWRASARVQAAVDASLPPGVDLHAYAVLLALADGEPRSQRWLADAVAVSKTTMSRIAVTLTERGDAERVRNAEDKRSYLLTRTPAGAATAEAWRAHAERVEAALSSGLTREERRELRGLLGAVVRPEVAAEAPEALLGSLGFLITRLHARMQTDATAVLRDEGFEPRFMGSMIVLRKLGAIPQAELARQLGLSTPSVVEIVDGLEGLGLVERRRDEQDRRTQRLHLTERAGPFGDEARTQLLRVTERHLGALDAEQRRRLVALLVQLVNG